MPNLRVYSRVHSVLGMHCVFYRRVSGLAAVLACTGSLLQGCYIPHPRFGADNFRQEQHTNGLPTYTASGSLAEYEKAGPVAAKVIAEACPGGNPTVLDGQAILTKGQNAYGMPLSSQWWTVTFTCEKAISGLSPPD